MAGRWTRGVLHLLVGGACAALVAWLAYALTRTVLVLDGPQRAVTLVLVALSVTIVVAVVAAPPVRPAEVALARALLAVDLPTPSDTSSRAARLRGVAWAGAVVVLGGLALLALLGLVPQGAILLLAAVDEPTRGTITHWPLADASIPLLIASGILALVLAVAVQPLAVVALERLAPVLLGPTDADRLAHAEAERRRLLAANALARDLHDSVGHSLTAIGVQAEAGARVAETDQDFARGALAAIAAESRRAITELDAVLGTLRSSPDDDARVTAPAATRVGGRASTRAGGRAGTPVGGRADTGPVPSLAERLAELGVGRAADGRGDGFPLVSCDVGGDLPPDVAEQAYRIVQEGLTNARRHGSGEVRGEIVRRGDEIVIRLENPIGEARPGGGRGLHGMRERAEQAGGTALARVVRAGTLEAGTDAGHDVWRLVARLPLSRDVGAEA